MLIDTPEPEACHGEGGGVKQLCRNCDGWQDLCRIDRAEGLCLRIRQQNEERDGLKREGAWIESDDGGDLVTEAGFVCDLWTEIVEEIEP